MKNKLATKQITKNLIKDLTVITPIEINKLYGSLDLKDRQIIFSEIEKQLFK